ncbi:CBO0543 family protein [Ammoniphilus sp. 3BR4]|uniref:CBO0543 family protein n=1 Tax=Ammoniphilus sp. 3BR4 TaxID=3158265 RepID=UPI0034650710
MGNISQKRKFGSASFSRICNHGYINDFGFIFGKWSYPVRVVPSALVYFPFRFGLLPVAVMFFIQFKPNLNPFVKAVIFGGLGAYVGMPVMAMLDLYKPIDWAYTYSFFILASMFIVAHWFSRINTFEKIQLKNIENRNYKFSFKFPRRREKIR